MRVPPGTRWLSRPAINGRDLGGLPLRNGGWTSFGTVFRLGLGTDRVPAAVARLARVPGAPPLHFFDLRSDAELTGPSGSDLAVHRMPLTEPGFAGVPIAARTPDFFRRHYLALLAPAAAVIGVVARTLATQPSRVVIGCRFGKDRTGVVVMLLLAVLGVRRRFVMADFALTARAFRRESGWVAEYARSRGEPPLEVLRRCSTPPTVAGAFLDELHRLAPSEDRLTQFIGVDRTQIAVVRSRLTGTKG